MEYQPLILAAVIIAALAWNLYRARRQIDAQTEAMAALCTAVASMVTQISSDKDLPAEKQQELLLIIYETLRETNGA